MNKREHVLIGSSGQCFKLGAVVSLMTWDGDGEQRSRCLHPDYHCAHQPADGGGCTVQGLGRGAQRLGRGMV